MQIHLSLAREPMSWLGLFTEHEWLKSKWNREEAGVMRDTPCIPGIYCLTSRQFPLKHGLCQTSAYFLRKNGELCIFQVLSFMIPFFL